MAVFTIPENGDDDDVNWERAASAEAIELLVRLHERFGGEFKKETPFEWPSWGKGKLKVLSSNACVMVDWDVKQIAVFDIDNLATAELYIMAVAEEVSCDTVRTRVC